MRFLPLLMFAFLVAIVPVVASADDGGGHRGGFVLRANGDYTLDAGQELNSLVVIHGDATVAGKVHEALVVIDGDARVSGTVAGDVLVVRGSLVLERGSSVKNVNLVRSDFTQEAGATVTGDISRRSFRLFGGALLLFGAIFWLWTTVAVLVAGLFFAAIGGKQLGAAASNITGAIGQSILGAVVATLGLPLVAIVAMVTVIGIPVGIGILVFLMPAVFFLGYLVAGTWLGSLMLSRTRFGEPGSHPYLQALLGLFALQVIVLVPVMGALAVVVAAPWGAGALVYHAWRGWREKPPAAPATLPVAPPVQPE